MATPKRPTGFLDPNGKIDHATQSKHVARVRVPAVAFSHLLQNSEIASKKQTFLPRKRHRVQVPANAREMHEDLLLREVDAEDPMPMPSEHLMELIYEYASLKSTPLAHNTLHPSALLATSIAVHEYMIELLTPMVKEHVQRCLDEEEGSVPIDDAPEIDLIDSSVPPDRHRILRRNSATMDDDNEFEAPEHSEEDEPEDVAPRSPTLSELLDEMDQASAAKNKSTRPFMDQD